MFYNSDAKLLKYVDFQTFQNYYFSFFMVFTINYNG